MKSLVWHGAFDVRSEEVPTPSLGDEEVLIKVGHAGICGSDSPFTPESTGVPSRP